MRAINAVIENCRRWVGPSRWHNTPGAPRGSDIEARRQDPPPRLRQLGENDPIRKAVERAMAGMDVPDEALADLCRAAADMKPSWIRSLNAAWALGRLRMGSEARDDAARALIECLRTRKWALTGCTGACAVGCLLNSTLAAPILGYMLVCDGRKNAVRAQAACSLGLLGCVEAVGDLALAMLDRNRPGCADVRDAARAALLHLLPMIGPEHYGALPTHTEAALVRLAESQQAGLQVPAIQALGHIGGSASVAVVTNLTREHHAKRVREAAAEALPRITARATRERDAARLLRPASAPGAAEDVLLRPVEAPPAGDVELLLRPAFEETEQTTDEQTQTIRH
jgi:HEAT repeat protein